MDDIRTWKFSKSISPEEVSEYLEQLTLITPGASLMFDLSDTVNIHSNFIGFLIHAKHHMQKIGGKLTIVLSLTVEKILIMLNIRDYFTPDIMMALTKKTA
jgi:hypothetical protein